jgi:hypothetical protein
VCICSSRARTTGSARWSRGCHPCAGSAIVQREEFAVEIEDDNRAPVHIDRLALARAGCQRPRQRRASRRSEKEGWRQLLWNPAFVAELRGVNVFVASHHGRENGSRVCASIQAACKGATCSSDGTPASAHQARNSPTDPRLRGKREAGIADLKSPLPAADPGAVIAHRGRKAHCQAHQTC